MNKNDNSKSVAKTHKLAIACAIANEKHTIENFITQLLDICTIFGEVKFIAVFDETDVDGTRQIVQKMSENDSRIIIIFASNCKKIVEAILIGYQRAIETEYKWILEINAGFRHQPEDLYKFVPHMLKDYDCIFGSRFMPGGSMKSPNLIRKIYSKGGTFLANLLLGTSLTDMTSGYQIINSKVAKHILSKKILSNYHFINTEMKVYCRNFKIIEVPISYETKAANLKMIALLDAFLNLYKLVVLRIFAKI